MFDFEWWFEWPHFISFSSFHFEFTQWWMWTSPLSLISLYQPVLIVIWFLRMMCLVPNDNWDFMIFEICWLLKIECELNDVIIPFCSSDVLKRNGLNWIKILNEMECGLWFHKECFCSSFENLTIFVFGSCLQDREKGVFHMTFHQTKKEC